MNTIGDKWMDNSSQYAVYTSLNYNIKYNEHE